MISQENLDNALRARVDYLAARSAANSALDWRDALKAARRLVASALRSSNYLSDISGALQESGAHMLVFRHLLAPPMSQDQFALHCKSWRKRTENLGLPVKPLVAIETAQVVTDWLDTAIAPWLVSGRPPRRSEFRGLFARTGALIASQQAMTRTRTRIALSQETAVIDLLSQRSWTRLPSKLIDTRAAVPPKHFMHKTRFATATTAHQEVDIACGLPGTYVLAMECKVTNDETNSVKRINDVIKKASAWRRHWGSFVHTAALLQGVIAPKDVQRLTDAEILVFWSHDLEAFGTWLDLQLSP